MDTQRIRTHGNGPLISVHYDELSVLFIYFSEAHVVFSIILLV